MITKGADGLLRMLDCVFYPCLAKTESEIISAEGFCPENQVFGRDRSDRNEVGVLIAVRASISANLFSVSNLNNAEFICVRLKSSKHNLYINCSYLSPSFNAIIYLHLGSVLFDGFQ